MAPAGDRGAWLVCKSELVKGCPPVVWGVGDKIWSPEGSMGCRAGRESPVLAPRGIVSNLGTRVNGLFLEVADQNGRRGWTLTLVEQLTGEPAQ